MPRVNSSPGPFSPPKSGGMFDFAKEKGVVMYASDSIKWVSSYYNITKENPTVFHLL